MFKSEGLKESPLASGNSLTAPSSLTKSRVAPGAGLGVSEARQIGILLPLPGEWNA